MVLALEEDRCRLSNIPMSKPNIQKTVTQSLGFAIFLTSLLSASAKTFDNFDGVAIDTGIWDVSLPFGTSQVAESAGTAILQGRGGLNTRESFSESISIQGRFRFTSTHDHFRIVFRSDLAFNSPFMEKSGMIVVFDQGGDVQIGESEKSTLAISPYSSDSWVDFLLKDDGNLVQLYVNDLVTPLLTARTDYRTGDKVGFYNREFAFTRLEVEYFNVQSLPDSGSAFGMLSAGFGFLIAFRFLQKPNSVAEQL